MHRNTIYVNMVELLFSKYYTDLMSFPSQLPTYHSLRLLTFLAWGVTAKLARISLSFFAASQIDSFLPKIFTTSAYDFISLSYPSKIFFFVDHFLKSLSNLLQYCFCFMFWLFGPEAGGSQLPDQGPNPYTPHRKTRSHPLDRKSRLKEVLHGCSVAHPNRQFHQACPLGPLLSKISFAWTQALRQLKVDLIVE